MKKKNILGSLSIFQKTIAGIGIVIFIYFALPLVILLTVGLLPALTALLTSRRDKGKLVSITCFNIAGIFYFLFQLLNNFTIQEALHIVTSVLSLIMIFGSAAIGLLIYYEMPGFFSYISKWNTKNRLKYIDGKVEKLKEEWGEDIILDKSAPETKAQA